MIKRLFAAFLVISGSAAAAAAQDIEVDKYNVSARIDLPQSTLHVRAATTISNLSASPKTRLYFRLAKLATVSAVSVAGAPAGFESAEDRRVTTLNQLTITPQSPLAAGASANLDVTYKIEVPESSPLAAVYAGEVLIIPEATWIPMPSTPFTFYGPPSAPFTLTVTATGAPPGFRPVSAGSMKTDPGSQSFVFEQGLNSLPFLIAGSFEQAAAVEHGGIKVEVVAQPGITNSIADQSREAMGAQGPPVQAGSGVTEQITRIVDESKRIIDFLVKTLGPAPSGSSFRIISSFRTGNITVPGALVLNQQVFRQDVLDVTTIELLADALARIWIDGRLRVRGREPRSAQGDRPAQKALSFGLLRDSMPRYLAALYFEQRSGKEASDQLFDRMRWTYTPVAQSKSDAELGIQTLLLPRYSAAIFNKGPLVFRLIAETAGRDKMLDALRSTLAGPQTKVVTFDDFRAALVKNTGPATETLFKQWIDSIIEPDIIIGIPVAGDRPGVQRVNLRNLGTGDVPVKVVGVTASGKRLLGSATVPSEDLTSVDFETGETLTFVEVDPDKLIIQTNYDNDTKPVRSSAETLLNEGITLLTKGDHALAESKLREAIKISPANTLLHAWLARALAVQNKSAESLREADAATGTNLPFMSALAWAYIAKGQIALAQNNAGEAVTAFRRAVIAAAEAPAQYAAREGLIKAERAANKLPPVDESVRNFIASFDSLIKQPSSDRLFSVVIRNNLKRFVQGLTVSPPSAWTTDLLRVDRLDSNRISLDVNLRVRADGRDQAGSAVYILNRAGGSWMLEDVRLFNVK